MDRRRGASIDDESQLVFERARDEALRRNHRYVRSEHVMLALLGDPRILELLGRLGITSYDVRAAIGKTFLKDAIPLQVSEGNVLLHAVLGKPAE